MPTTDIPSFIGAPVQRREDPALITGSATYVDDLLPAGTLHLAVVRSPFAHARVTSIDTSLAEAMAGVVAVIRPEHVASQRMPTAPNPARNIPSRHPLAQGKVLMPGDPVVAVVAKTAALARDAAEAVFVYYEPLDPVGGVVEALNAPPIHEGQADNLAYDRSKGDRAAFDSAPGPVRLSGVVEHPRVVPAPMETRSILAEWKDGGLQVHRSMLSVVLQD